MRKAGVASVGLYPDSPNPDLPNPNSPIADSPNDD